VLCESGFHYLIEDNRFVQQSSQDVEANRIALDDLTGLECLGGDHIAIHIPAVSAFRAEHETVREGIRVSDGFGMEILEGLFVVLILLN